MWDDLDEYEKDKLSDDPTDIMNDEAMRFYWYIRWSNRHGGKKPAAE